MDDQDAEYQVEDLYRRTNCQDALHTLYHYLDGELTAAQREVIARHLDGCAPCLHAFDFEAELKVVIARSCRDQVPESLRHKIAEALHRASEDASRGRQGSV